MLQPAVDRQRMRPRRVGRPQLASRHLRGAEAEALSAMLRNLKRSSRLIIAVTLIGTGLVSCVTLSLAPQYVASAMILVDPRKTQMLKDRDVVGGPGTDNSAIESEAEMLQSPALARRVAERLKLHEDTEFTQSVGLFRNIKAAFLGILRGVGLASPSAPNDDPTSNAADVLRTKTYARRRNLTYVIEVTGWSKDAEKAARIVNTLTELYLADQVAAKSAAVSHAHQLLQQRVQELRDRVAASERAYEEFKADTGLFDPGGQSLSDRQLSQLNEQLVAARARAAEARAKFEQLRNITPGKLLSAAASPDVLQSGVVSSLRVQYADVSRKRAELTTRYGPRHPQVVNIQAELANVSKQITDEIRRIVGSARTEYEMASNRERSLQASLDELKERAGSLNQKGIRLRELERDAQANRTLFEAFLTRTKETSALLNMQLPDSRVISAARTPNAPSYPRKGLMIGLGFFGSLGLGLAVALARTGLNRGFQTLSELRAAFGLQPLATIPLVEGDTRAQDCGDAPLRLLDRLLAVRSVSASGRVAGLVLHDPKSIFAESIHSFRFALKAALSAHHGAVVLMTSVLPGEGKSTLAANLARAAAASRQRVLLIDADLRKQGLARAFNLKHAPGLAALLTGSSDFGASAHRDQLSGLQIITGSGIAYGAEALALLSSDSMKTLIEWARSRFDLVVIDAPPLLTVADARVLLDHVDAAVLVVASNNTTEQAVAAAFEETPGLEDKLVGAVLNRAANDFSRYYYGREAPTATAGGIST